MVSQLGISGEQVVTALAAVPRRTEELGPLLARTMTRPQGGTPPHDAGRAGGTPLDGGRAKRTRKVIEIPLPTLVVTEHEPLE